MQPKVTRKAHATKVQRGPPTTTISARDIVYMNETKREQFSNSIQLSLAEKVPITLKNEPAAIHVPSMPRHVAPEIAATNYRGQPRDGRRGSQAGPPLQIIQTH